MHVTERLQDKRVVIVGSATGIGAAVARRVASERAIVCLADVDFTAAEGVADTLIQQGCRAFAVPIDISDEDSVKQAFAGAIKELGGLDAVHVNAADMRALASDSDVLAEDLEIFDRIIRVNLRGHFLCTRAALPAILEAGGGAIVYTSSGSADVGEPVRPAYAVSKSGLHALMRHVASRWGRDGVTANAIAAGFTMTPERRAKLAAGKGAGNASEALMDELRKRTPSPRFGEVDDHASMVALLLSEEGKWINGQVIHINGGSFMR